MRRALLSLMVLASFGVVVAMADQENAPPMPGSDVDAHGCKPSAGYTWCEKTAKCEQPWTLAKEAGFDNSAEGFKAYCEG